MAAPRWCSHPRGTSYREVAYLTTSWAPIRVLARKSHGWDDIGVWVQGGGIQPGYETDLFFNGKAYRGRDKATMRPSRRLRERKLPGEVVISRKASQTGTPLSP